MSSSSSSRGSSSNSNNGTPQPPLMMLQSRESMAYPRRSNWSSRLSYCMRQHSTAVGCTLAFLLFLGVVASDSFHDWQREGAAGSSSSTTRTSGLRGRSNNVNAFWGGAQHAGYFDARDAVVDPNTFRFGAVTDLDELSRKQEGNKKPSWLSHYVAGTLAYHPATARYTIGLDSGPTAQRQLITNHNEAGRGAEFSELVIYQNRLLTFDDRTGDVFEILNQGVGAEQTSFVVPRYVITEGDGDTDKGMKWEWATIKDGLLYMGSMGKEYTLPDGTVKNRNNMWVGVLNEHGELRRENWSDRYNFVKRALLKDDASIGYMIIEAVNWSDALQRWVFLPRRISNAAYDEIKDEQMGGNKIVLVNADFSDAKVITIANLDADRGYRGFSTFAFVPNTHDRHVLAIRSVEENCVGFGDACQQRTYFIVFDIDGNILSNELEFPDKVKFEGVEFVDVYTAPKL